MLSSITNNDADPAVPALQTELAFPNLMNFPIKTKDLAYRLDSAATRSIYQVEARSTATILGLVMAEFYRSPKRLIADTSYGRKRCSLHHFLHSQYIVFPQTPDLVEKLLPDRRIVGCFTSVIEREELR